jgi:long-chain acyl-CoA synthetase
MAKHEPAAPWLKYYDWRERHLEYPDISMYEQLSQQVDRTPDLIAIDYFGTKISYKAFRARIDKCAKALIGYNIKRGDAVTVISANTPEALTVIYASNKIGAIANIVHPLSSEADIKHAIELAQSEFVFVIDGAYAVAKQALAETKVRDIVVLSPADSMLPLMKTAYGLASGGKLRKALKNKRVMTYSGFISSARNVEDRVRVETGADTEAVILYSGGTTGTPKGVLLTNRAFVAHALQCPGFLKAVKEGKKILGILPIFHGFGLSYGIHVGMCSGITNILLPKFDAKSFHKLLARKKPNIIVGVPTLFEAMAQNKKIAKLKLDFIDALVCGGDVLPNFQKKRIDKALYDCGCNVEILRGYGLTEYLAGAMFTPPERPKEGCTGIPLADVYVKIVEPGTDVEKPYGELGEIVIHGPSMMIGYVNNEEETAKTLRKHKDGLVWLHSGDIGKMDEEGYIFFEQRLKRLIISSGYNVYPNHIEDVIGEIEGVVAVTVVAAKDKYRGEVAHAYVVVEKEGIVADELMRRKIMAHCKKKLPKFSLPWKIMFRESIPKTKLNKVDYLKLMKDNE